MSIINNKKGLEREMLVFLILAIVGFAIIIWYIYVIKPYSMFDKKVCETSIETRTIPVVGMIEKATTPLNCRTEQVKIDKSYKTEEQIKKEIADEMLDCWNMVGRGERNFMPQGFWTEGYCLICSNIQFDSKIKQEFPVIAGILSYMNATKMDGMTYYNAIWGENSYLPGGIDVNVDTSKDYAVMFSLKKAGWLSSNKGAVATVIIAGSVILAIATGGAAAPVVGVLSTATTTTATATTTTMTAVFASEAAATLGTTILTGVATGASQFAIGAGLGKMALNTFFLTSAGEAGLHLIPNEGKEIQKYCTRFENAP